MSIEEKEDPFFAIKNAIDHGHNVFISGVGGTGKSYLLKQLFAHYKQVKKSILTSTTGISAYNIEGVTLHSFTKIILPPKLPEDMTYWTNMLIRKISKNKFFYKQYRDMQLIFIDEVSMLGMNYLDVMNHVFSVIRANELPFGGVQFVLSGDMLQLPPVKDDYPFLSESWEQLHLQYFLLTKAHRFADQKWVDLLQRSRLGDLTKTDISILQGRLVKNQKSIKTVDEDLEPGTGTTTSEEEELSRPIFLSSKNAEVDNINGKMLNKLDSDSVTLRATDAVEKASYLKRGLTMRKLETAVFPPDVEAQFITDKEITLKVGAQVMLLANLDQETGLVNGSKGIVLEIQPDPQAIIIKFDNGVVCTIPQHVFKFEQEDIVYIRTGLPLRLAWAVTIHKCQGLTLEEAEIDIGDSIFCKGQSYVALSRCKSLEGTFIKSFDPYKMKPDPKALKFEREFMKVCTKL